MMNKFKAKIIAIELRRLSFNTLLFGLILNVNQILKQMIEKSAKLKRVILMFNSILVFMNLC